METRLEGASCAALMMLNLDIFSCSLFLLDAETRSEQHNKLTVGDLIHEIIKSCLDSHWRRRQLFFIFLFSQATPTVAK